MVPRWPWRAAMVVLALSLLLAARDWGAAAGAVVAFLSAEVVFDAAEG